MIIAIFLGLTITYGQTKEICGKVFDKEDNSPIAGVIVQVKDSSDNSYQYTITNDKGEYCIRYNVSVAELLRFQCMGYKSQEINISEIQSNNTIYMVSHSISSFQYFLPFVQIFNISKLNNRIN